jgi:hypothetical protein
MRKKIPTRKAAALRHYRVLKSVGEQHHHEPDRSLGVRIPNIPSAIAQQSLEQLEAPKPKLFGVRPELGVPMSLSV